MKRALVTGGCGFIGSNLTRKLVNLGWKVEVVDDLSNGDINNLSDLNLRIVTAELLMGYDSINEENKTLVITGDFASRHVLSRVVEQRYDFVFHLAALPRVEFSVTNPVLTTEENVMKSICLLTACINNVDKLIFSSSSSIYGDTKTNFPSKENGQLNPQSPYALQKRVVEDFCRLYSNLYNLETVSLRYFNVYGPGQLGDSPYSTAISAWMDKIHQNLPLRSDGDGEQTRDLIFVDDVVEANILAALNKNSFKGEIFNIGTGKNYSNNDILGILKEKFDFEIEYAPKREGDVKHTKANIDKAKENLKFKSKINLLEGLNKTISWWGLDEK